MWRICFVHLFVLEAAAVEACNILKPVRELIDNFRTLKKVHVDVGSDLGSNTYDNAIKLLIEETSKLFHGKDTFVLLFEVSKVDNTRYRHTNCLAVDIGKIVRYFGRSFVLNE